MSSSNNNLKNLDLEKIPSAKNLRFGIVVSKWNSNITTNLLNGCLELLYNKGVNKEDIDILYVPGSFELIYGCKTLQNKNYDSVIAIGIFLYGLAYFIVHDIFIHQRFKIFRNIDNKYARGVRRAHKIHHKHLGKKDGECFGMLIVPRKYFK